MPKALITFAKAPVPGTVKTRLQADLGTDRTVLVYRAFVEEILSQCSRLKDIDRFLGCAPSKDHPFLKEMAKAHGLKMFNQQGDSLGEKIFNAFRYCSRKGYSEIVLIGSDSPSLPFSFIKKAFSELKKNDIVIGPCFDQGLYLIGVKKDRIPALSRTVELDTGRDVSMILRQLKEGTFRCAMLPFWYDIDTIDDFHFLQLHLAYLSKNTRP